MGIRDKRGLAVAEFVCRAVDRHDPSRVRGPHRRARRGHLRRILREYARYYIFVRTPGYWTRRLLFLARFSRSDVARPGWLAASPIRPDLGFQHAQWYDRRPIRKVILKTGHSAQPHASSSTHIVPAIVHDPDESEQSCRFLCLEQRMSLRIWDAERFARGAELVSSSH